MNVREWLLQILELNILIDSKKERIKELWSSATYPGVSYEFRVQSSKKKDKSDIVCKIIELEKEVETLQKAVKQRQKALQEVLNQFDNKAMATIMIKRYIEFKTWNVIASEMDCSRRWVLQLHSRAIKKMSKSLGVHIESVV